MQDLVLIGAGGFGREVAWLVSNINRVKETWNLIGFIDNNSALKGETINGIPVLGGVEWFGTREANISVVSTIGNAKTRRKSISELSRFSYINYVTLIDPSVVMSEWVDIGEGSIICAGSILTVNITLGTHVIVNLDCTIGHDAVIGDYSTLYPSVNLSGNTLVNNNVELGTGSQVIQGITIEEGTIVGAGAVVVRDLPANCTAVGSPAKPIKFN
ncbi:transferase [Paenibacillus sp. FSL P4-0081]|uniref:acetyltransferase n=1 Tax=Paenibacillus sp. FSL P4-0081 TaxID=1536769 RepID=UPI0004F735AA|nr:acetyltransferase [Paenibacillus sp. FSL P4-0081]AIQ31986.1 transferase [Paenibacillus sp. FSL P4-0081]